MLFYLKLDTPWNNNLHLQMLPEWINCRLEFCVWSKCKFLWNDRACNCFCSKAFIFHISLAVYTFVTLKSTDTLYIALSYGSVLYICACAVYILIGGVGVWSNFEFLTFYSCCKLSKFSFWKLSLCRLDCVCVFSTG